MTGIRARLSILRQRLKLDLFKEVGRQYPVFCFLLVILLLATVLLNRYFLHYSCIHVCWACGILAALNNHISDVSRFLHIIMVFWSFLAGVVTFYCSFGPDTLLPNIFLSIKPKVKVSKAATCKCGAYCLARGSNKTINLIWACYCL